MINKCIDHTILEADVKESEFNKIIKEAIEHKFYAVCVNPYFVKKASELLKETDIKVCTVVGFPLGQNTTKTKVFEALDACENGADEIDMVMNISALKEGDEKYVLNEIKSVREAIPKETVLKVIIETCLLEDHEIALAAQLCSDAGADFVKTSTGFSTGGATVKAINIIKENISENVKIKASGGIRDSQRAKLMIETGASRIGSSKSVTIVQG